MTNATLCEFVGRRLLSAVGTFHFYAGRPSANPLAVRFVFAEGSLSVTGASDGWHVVVSDDQLDERDMQESGSIRLADLGAAHGVAMAIGQSLRQVWLISTQTALADMIGLRLDFEGSTIRVLNWGDEILVDSLLPSDADSNDIIEQPISCAPS